MLQNVIKDLEKDGPNHIFLLYTGHQRQRPQVWGTCFEVAPCIALTAKHVVAGWIKEYSNGRLRADDDESIRNFLEFQTRQGLGDAYMPFVLHSTSKNTALKRRVCAWSFSMSSDIAWLLLEPSGITENFSMGLTLDPPQRKTGLRIFGYPKQERGETAEGQPTYTIAPYNSKGEVLGVKFEPRDRVMIYFPHIEFTACNAESGMSGSPIIDDQGFVCGVLSCATPDGPEGWHGYAAILVDAFTAGPLVEPVAGINFDPYEAAKSGILKVRGIERLEIDFSTRKLNFKHILNDYGGHDETVLGKV